MAAGAAHAERRRPARRRPPPEAAMRRTVRSLTTVSRSIAPPPRSASSRMPAENSAVPAPDPRPPPAGAPRKTASAVRRAFTHPAGRSGCGPGLVQAANRDTQQINRRASVTPPETMSLQLALTISLPVGDERGIGHTTRPAPLYTALEVDDESGSACAIFVENKDLVDSPAHRLVAGCCSARRRSSGWPGAFAKASCICFSISDQAVRLSVDRPAHRRGGRAHPRRARARGRGPGARRRPARKAVPAPTPLPDREYCPAPAPSRSACRSRRSGRAYRQRELPVPVVRPATPTRRMRRSRRPTRRSPIEAAYCRPRGSATASRWRSWVAHLRRHCPCAHAARSSDAAEALGHVRRARRARPRRRSPRSRSTALGGLAAHRPSHARAAGRSTPMRPCRKPPREPRVLQLGKGADGGDAAATSRTSALGPTGERVRTGVM